MHIRKLVAGAAVALGMACGSAIAAPITGSVSIDFGEVNDGGGPLAGGSTLNISEISYFASPGAGNLALLAGSTVEDFSITLTLGSAVVFTGPGGTYEGAVSELFIPPSGSFAGVVSVDGLFTPDSTFEKPSGFYPFDDLDPNPATEVSLTFTFTVGADGAPGSYAGGAVMFAAEPTTPDNIPEPMTLSLFGLGLAGLGMAMRRRPAA
ncbi:PEP-CTERM sorting domain-containing protein [Falsiroseomonas sp.]|uniref:PEP-CTERM sorting domain-containing protein n=1 Tax=Falsiroseomonas sp. TaxID=2870721 RepID=UPI00356B1DB2